MQPHFASFLMGGFECATHVRRDRRRLDLLASTHHDRCAAADFRLLQTAGIRTVRDGIRWHLIEAEPGVFQWQHCLPMIEAAHSTGTEVIWDLCHWGVPAWADPFAPQFPMQFAHFAAAFAERLAQQRAQDGITSTPFFCPVNEISFWAWTGGDTQHLAPFGRGRGPELKRQLAHAAILATRAVRRVLPSARFVQAEPIIHITPSPTRPESAAHVHAHNAAQFEAWDLLAGRAAPELGGAEDILDILGVNYYWNNQWIDHGDRTPIGHPDHIPLHAQLFALHQRYSRPILVSETGAEADAATGWLGLVAAEVRQARALGADVCGLCLYPVTDYPGWDDDRHVQTGLLALDRSFEQRSIRPLLLEEILLQQRSFAGTL